MRLEILGRGGSLGKRNHVRFVRYVGRVNGEKCKKVTDEEPRKRNIRYPSQSICKSISIAGRSDIDETACTVP